jgi:hypothetical protein
VDDLLFDSFYNIRATPVDALIHFLKEKNIPYQIQEKYVMAQLEENQIPEIIRELTQRKLAVYEIFRHQFSLEEAFLASIKGAET